MLTSQITVFHRPIYFEDVMRKGPFRSMRHDHFFCELPEGLTEMKDLFRFAAPVPALGILIEKVVLARHMQSLLHERNRVIKEVAESDDWRRYLQPGGKRKCAS